MCNRAPPPLLQGAGVQDSPLNSPGPGVLFSPALPPSHFPSSMALLPVSLQLSPSPFPTTYMHLLLADRLHCSMPVCKKGRRKKDTRDSSGWLQRTQGRSTKIRWPVLTICEPDLELGAEPEVVGVLKERRLLAESKRETKREMNRWRTAVGRLGCWLDEEDRWWHRSETGTFEALFSFLCLCLEWKNSTGWAWPTIGKFCVRSQVKAGRGSSTQWTRRWLKGQSRPQKWGQGWYPETSALTRSNE